MNSMEGVPSYSACFTGAGKMIPTSSSLLGTLPTSNNDGEPAESTLPCGVFSELESINPCSRKDHREETSTLNSLQLGDREHLLPSATEEPSFASLLGSHSDSEKTRASSSLVQASLASATEQHLEPPVPTPPIKPLLPTSSRILPLDLDNATEALDLQLGVHLSAESQELHMLTESPETQSQPQCRDIGRDAFDANLEPVSSTATLPAVVEFHPPARDIFAADYGPSLLDQSYANYFAPYLPREEALDEEGDKMKHTAMSNSTSAFPESQESALRRRIRGRESEIADLRFAAEKAVSGTSVRLAEVRGISQDADSLKSELELEDSLLIAAGWPFEALVQVQQVLSSLGHWESIMRSAQSRIEDEGENLVAAVDLLETVASAWLNLKTTQEKFKGIDLSLAMRANNASPLMSALADTIVTEIRTTHDRVSADRFDKFMGDPVMQHVFTEELKVWLPQAGTMKDLKALLDDSKATSMIEAKVGRVTTDSILIPVPEMHPHPALQNSEFEVKTIETTVGRAMTNSVLIPVPEVHPHRALQNTEFEAKTIETTVGRDMKNSVLIPMPEVHPHPVQQKTEFEAKSTPEVSSVFWEALSSNRSLDVIESLLSQGGHVPSGRAQDGSQHSIFWHVIARGLPEVGLALLRHFPPSAPNGVDTSEVHARRGDSLLHLLCCTESFTTPYAELFINVFASSPEHVWAHKNSHGQSFAHIAAAKLNFFVLTHSMSRWPGLVHSLTSRDLAGWSPLVLLARHMRKAKDGEPKPPGPTAASHRVPPSWDKLGLLLPRQGHSAPAFADVDVEIEDASMQRRVILHAHRVVLAAASSQWHEQLYRTFPSFKSAALKIDPGCCRSVAVLAEALHFVYTGEFKGCLREDGRLLWQLLCLVTAYRLPEALKTYTVTMLLRSLLQPENRHVLPVLLRRSKQMGLSTTERKYVLYRLLCANNLSGEHSSLLQGDGDGQKDCMSNGFQKEAETARLALGELERHFSPTST